jgi:2-polyprenyl-3-methyl-5-hydroxy-6-metoxy-1,4-benzoquinol methylase
MVDESWQRHWDGVYSGGPTEERGWYEPAPSTLDLVLRHSDPTDGVIDIGAGDSGLPTMLRSEGYGDITMLDVSDVALERSRRRLGEQGATLTWLRADVTDWEPNRTWEVWHDRAVFHFLIDEADRKAYVNVARSALVPGGRLIVATFSPEGPDRCAGLPVRRYSGEDLVAAFTPGFEPVEVVDIEPASTIGDRRPYVAVVLRRQPSA